MCPHEGCLEITLIDERNSNLFNVGYHGTKLNSGVTYTLTKRRISVARHWNVPLWRHARNPQGDLAYVEGRIAADNPLPYLDRERLVEVLRLTAHCVFIRKVPR